jgi:hypothetical protein
MGGPGTVGRWIAEAKPRGRRDAVHFTRAGYAWLADAFVQDFLAAYDAWQSRTVIALAPRATVR